MAPFCSKTSPQWQPQHLSDLYAQAVLDNGHEEEACLDAILLPAIWSAGLGTIFRRSRTVGCLHVAREMLAVVWAVSTLDYSTPLATTSHCPGVRHKTVAAMPLTVAC